ncbi:UNVERIFIED_CONTAM: hypothetical protein RMT77_011947 [Armadillidium vulgare]
MPVKDIRVQDRGSFFDDSFFKDSWDDFDTAMQRVLDRFDDHGIKGGNKSRPQCQDMYRKIRTNQIDDDMYASQAIHVTEKDGRFQVVVDVRDFNPTDLQVKVVDEKVILEGRYDKVSEDGKSSSSKAFYREFMLPPEADIDLISTALSRDGILTIRAPRKEGIPPPVDEKTSASQFIQSALNDHRYGNGSRYPHGYESSEPYDTLPKDVKDRLVLSDKDSGRGSATASPIPSSSGFSNTPSCASPAPSDIGSSASTEFDPRIRSDFRGAQNPPGTQGPHGNYSYPQNQMNISRSQPKKSSAAVGSGGTASISVKEEDGKRTLTSEKSSLVQQKDGFLESKEVAAEVTEKDSQAARREAITRMMKTDEDPEGRFKKSEAADASDVSETCVKHLPDGSVVTVKKSSTSTSNFKTSFSSGGVPGQSLFDSDFPVGFGPMPSLMNRGPSLISQMSSDSLSSNMSNFSDMSNFSRFSDMSSFPDMASGFPSRNPFPDRNPFPERFSTFSNFPAFTTTNQAQHMDETHETKEMPNTQSSHMKKTFTSSAQNTYSSNFDNMKF